MEPEVRRRAIWAGLATGGTVLVALLGALVAAGASIKVLIIVFVIFGVCAIPGVWLGLITSQAMIDSRSREDNTNCEE